MRKKGKTYSQVTIENVAAEGKCVARVDNRVIFVESVVPGDVVDIRIRGKKKKYLEAFPTTFHRYSELRKDPFCSHFGICGGCKWQHLDYETQLHYKRQQVIDQLERIGKLELPEVAPIIASEHTRHYRNKLEFTFSNHRWLTREEIDREENFDRNALGFHIPRRFDKILDIERCYLQPDPSNAIRLAVKQHATEHQLSFFDLVNQKGFLRNLIIRNSNRGEVMVILQVFYDDRKAIRTILDHLQSTFPEITSLNYVVNPKKNETFQDLEVVNYHGNPFIVEEMPAPGDEDRILQFRISPKSFFQTNTEQARILYQKAWELAALTGQELVYDLYTGTGTIANFVAGHARKVVGLEYVAEAIEDAKINSAINGITNTEFYAGDIKDLLNPSFLIEHRRPDVIITDPPRAGMHADVCKMILKAKPEKVVYVSCNPATQARDVALLGETYSVVAVQPVDMFPHTHHVECVCLLELRK